MTKTLLTEGDRFQVYALVRDEARAAKAIGTLLTYGNWDVYEGLKFGRWHEWWNFHYVKESAGFGVA